MHVCVEDIKVYKGVWGMPWLLEATKDVIGCAKPRGEVYTH